MFKKAISILLISSSLVLSTTSPSSFANTVDAVQQQAIADKLNINDATVEQLMKLPGIGRKKAEAIVQFRQDVDGFRDVKEIMDVKGIGEKLFSKFEHLIAI